MQNVRLGSKWVMLNFIIGNTRKSFQIHASYRFLSYRFSMHITRLIPWLTCRLIIIASQQLGLNDALNHIQSKSSIIVLISSSWVFNLLSCTKKPIDDGDYESVILPWASYHIRKIAGCACAGRAGNDFPTMASKETTGWRSWQASRQVRDARAVMHVGSANPRVRENAPGIPSACATRNFTHLARGPWSLGWGIL